MPAQLPVDSENGVWLQTAFSFYRQAQFVGVHHFGAHFRG